MALELGEGFKPYVLNSIAQVAGSNDPQMKVQTPGTLNYLLTKGAVGKTAVDLNTGDGGRRFVRIKQKQRLTDGFVQDGAPDCDNTNVIAPFETDVDLTIQKWYAVYRTDEDMQKFIEAASNPQSFGATSVARDLVEDVMLGANAMLQELDQDLLTLLVGAVGVNRNTGNANAKSVNINRDANANILSDGETEILKDWQDNQNMGRPNIIGAGLMHSYFLQQGAKSANNAGLDTRFFANQMDFYYDLNAQTIAGNNQVLAVADGAATLVEFFQNKGKWSGKRPGASEFFTMMLPIFRGNDVVPVEVDVQIRYEDCTRTLTDQYYDTSLTLTRGWNIIVSKQCGLYTLSDASYRATDVLNGNTGIYRYTITNTCDAC